MEVKKQIKSKGGMFARLIKGNLQVSAAVRDAWLPHRFLNVKIVDGKVLMRPTDNENDYRLTLPSTNQMMLCWCFANRFSKLPQRTRLPIFEIEPGLYLMEVPDLGGGSDG